MRKYRVMYSDVRPVRKSGSSGRGCGRVQDSQESEVCPLSYFCIRHVPRLRQDMGTEKPDGWKAEVR